ncbi:NADPH oxidase 4-like [Malaya genurostris]|uniref:NADPH oxidase 4-like n=1 Tax=Malaya genurostris TaxID=325434 RepID=UPI0026F391D5|nr:NADPH oxidase 4-like [Malaya genurostris]
MERTGKIYHTTRNFMFKYFLAFVWLGFNFVVFCKIFSNYHHEPRYYYLSKILGIGLCISRATAPVLNLIMALITLPMCRTFNLFMNSLFARCSIRALVFYLEKVKAVHIALGAFLIIVGMIHTLTHLANIINFIEHYNERFPTINWAVSKRDSVFRLLIATPTGFSGCVMMIALFAIAYFSSRQMRDRFYNNFITSHHLFIVFYGMMFYHPLSNILKYQSNVKAHPNGCDLIDENIFRNDSVLQAICKEDPEFTVDEKHAWIWPLIGLSVYVLDVTYRYLIIHSNSKRVSTLQSYVLPGNGIYLKLRFTCNKQISVKPGQYVLIQCPALSTLEWHPFSVVDFPTAIHNTVSLAIAVRGDWTQKLYDAVLEKERFKKSSGGIEYYRRIKFLLDGPYPSPMASMLTNERIVYIAAGVGITPFAGFVRYLLNMNANHPSRIHLIWIVKNAEMFTWFADEIAKLQDRFWKQNKPDRFTMKFYWTQNYNQNMIEEYFSDYPTLKARIYKGRPIWEEVFMELVTLYPRKPVTIYSCGPRSLTKDVKSFCRQHRKHECKFTHLHCGFG